VNPAPGPLAPSVAVEPREARSHTPIGSWRTQMRSCDQCGQEFTPRRRRQRFCSRACKLAYHGLLRKALERANCAYCGAVFRPRRSTARFCRPACRAAWHRRRKRLASTPAMPTGP